jgi:penicillin-binding protein 1A
MKEKWLKLYIFLLLFVIAGAGITRTIPQYLLPLTGIAEWEYQPKEQTVLLFRDGAEMARTGYLRVHMEQYPERLKTAVIMVEDQRFYQHPGIDFRGIARAIWENIKAGEKVQGASTITQQLVRTLFLNQEKTYGRKIREIVMAVALEEKYSKAEILNMYLNEVFMGRGSYGMQKAAENYFRKDVNQLDWAEICMLAGLIQAPEHFSPDRNWEGLKNRQEIVIDILVENRVISAAQGQELKERPLKIQPPLTQEIKHPYLVSYTIAQAVPRIGTERLLRGGYKIYTTLDKDMLEIARQTVALHSRLIKAQGIKADDIALVSISPENGAVRALIGGVNYRENQINMAISPRQPGSSIKPLYYAAALNEGLVKEDTLLNNQPRAFGDGYQPTNYSAAAPFRVSLREALVDSHNVASIEVMELLGIDTVIKYLKSFGITTITDDDRHLAMGLGGMGQGVSPLEMANAYCAFANQGLINQPYIIERIEDSLGKTVFQQQPAPKRVISIQAAALINDILVEAAAVGTGKAAWFQPSLKGAGKTGTTSNSTDLWYIGYLRELVTAVWVGNSDGEPVRGSGAFGGTISAPIWRDYMRSLYYRHLLSNVPQPTKKAPENEVFQEPESPILRYENPNIAKENKNEPSIDQLELLLILKAYEKD